MLVSSVIKFVFFRLSALKIAHPLDQAHFRLQSALISGPKMKSNRGRVLLSAFVVFVLAYAGQTESCKSYDEYVHQLWGQVEITIQSNLRISGKPQTATNSLRYLRLTWTTSRSWLKNGARKWIWWTMTLKRPPNPECSSTRTNRRRCRSSWPRRDSNIKFWLKMWRRKQPLLFLFLSYRW